SAGRLGELEKYCQRRSIRSSWYRCHAAVGNRSRCQQWTVALALKYTLQRGFRYTPSQSFHRNTNPGCERASILLQLRLVPSLHRSTGTEIDRDHHIFVLRL